MMVSTASRVVPLMSHTMERSSPAIALRSEDLPGRGKGGWRLMHKAVDRNQATGKGYRGERMGCHGCGGRGRRTKTRQYCSHH